jgi:hypothetical protein
MGAITRQIMIAGSKSQRQYEVLFDTGASACFARQDVASELGQVVTSPFSIAFRLGNNAVITVDKTIDLFLDLKGHKLSFYFLVVPELPYEIIVGADFFHKWKIKPGPIAEDFIIDEKALEIMLV